MTTDGKYLTFNLLMQYIIGQRTDPNNPTVFNGAVSGTPDDTIINDVLFQAETMFDELAGTGFDAQTLTMTQPIQAFVDGYGWLNLVARERGPVTAVSAIQTRILSGGNTTWQTVTWDAADGIILPPSTTVDAHPWPESWRVRVFPASVLPRLGTDQILVRWTYTGGFVTIPYALQMLIARMAYWLYKLREAPLGTTINLPLGTAIAPLQMPKDIMAQIALWRPVYG